MIQVPRDFSKGFADLRSMDLELSSKPSQLLCLRDAKKSDGIYKEVERSVFV